jgi:hypothetical protein
VSTIKSKIVIIFICFICIVTMYLLVSNVNKSCMNFAESITLKSYYKKENNVNTYITNNKDFEELIEICGSNSFIPATKCPFGSIELIFKGNGKKLVVYPACDSCSVIRIGDNKYVDIGDQNKIKLEKILKKYGASMHWHEDY